MRIPLDRQSAVPLYQQIKTYLRLGILSGSLAADTRLPASRQLARDLGVNRITVFTVNNASGPYQTTKFFIDEIDGEEQTLSMAVTFNAGTTPTEVEAVTNLNRRDKADQDNMIAALKT